MPMSWLYKTSKNFIMPSPDSSERTEVSITFSLPPTPPSVLKSGSTGKNNLPQYQLTCSALVERAYKQSTNTLDWLQKSTRDESVRLPTMPPVENALRSFVQNPALRHALGR